MFSGVRIIGDIEADLQKFERAQAAAVTEGVREATSGVKHTWRRQISGAGLGTRLGNTIRDYNYPKSGKSLNAAGVVVSKAPHLIQAYDKGAVLKSRHGRFLAIPTENVRNAPGSRLKANPANFEEAGIPLRYVPPGNGRRYGLLVADNFRISDKGYARVAGKRALKSGRGVATVVMFILVPTVRIRKRLDVEGIATRWGARLPKLIEDHLP